MAADAPTARKPMLAVLPRVSQQLTKVLGIGLLVLLAVWLVGNFVTNWQLTLSLTLTGITLGAMYCLVALGYTLVYGIIELINFAHGDVFMWGSMLAVTIGVTILGLDGSQSGFVTAIGVIATMLAAMLICASGNVFIERFAYRPLRNAPKLAPLITAIGVSFILQAMALRAYGPGEQTADGVFPNSNLFSIGIYGYPTKNVLVVVFTIPVLLALVYLVRNTRQGKAMRAVAQDTDAARMMGIDVDRIIAFTFALGGGLAGAGGTLFVFWQTSTRYDLGFQLGLFAFTAAVLGGIGNLQGAALGSLMIGLLQAYNDGAAWHAPGSNWTQSMIFTILILVLVFRPEGLLGEQVADRA
jgi:branched-chain amino acid transport system permease protein